MSYQYVHHDEDGDDNPLAMQSQTEQPVRVVLDVDYRTVEGYAPSWGYNGGDPGEAPHIEVQSCRVTEVQDEAGNPLPLDPAMLKAFQAWFDQVYKKRTWIADKMEEEIGESEFNGRPTGNRRGTERITGGRRPGWMESIDRRLHLTEDDDTGTTQAKQYYDATGWVGGEIPLPREFKAPDGTMKDDLGQLDNIIGPQYDYPEGCYIRSTKAPAPGWADIRPEEVLSPEEIGAESKRAARFGSGSSPYKLREAARIKKIMGCIKKHTYSVLKKISRQYPSYSIEDMAGGATLQLLKALRDQLDQARPGNKFLTWATQHLEVGATHGTGGGAEHRKARGELGRLLSARRPEQVDAVLNQVSEPNRSYHDFSNRTSTENPFGKFTPRIFALAQRLREALVPESETAGDIDSIKAELESTLEEVSEDEEGTVGAKTGFMKGGISIPHSGQEDWQHFVKNVKVGSTHTKGEGGDDIERSEIATGKGGNYGEGNRADFKDIAWPDLNDAPPETSETFRAALEFSMQQFLAMQDEGEQAFKLTPGIRERLKNELQVDMESVPPLDLQQIRYICRKLGLRNYPTKGQTYDLEFDRKRFRDLVSQMTAGGMPEQQAKLKAREQASSKWLQMGNPTMDSKIDQAAKNQYKKLGTEPEVPTLKDLAPMPVDPRSFEGAGKEGPAKDLKRLEDSMRLFGVWYWLFSRYEMNEATIADKIIVEAGWNWLRKKLIHGFLNESSTADVDYLTIVLYG